MPRRNTQVVEVDGEDVRRRYAEDPEAEFTEDEIRWMQDLGVSQPGEFDEQPVTFLTPDGRTISNDPAFFSAQRVQDEEAFNAAVEARAKQMAKEMVIADQHGENATAGEYHGNALNQPASGGSVSHPADNSAAPDEEGDEELPDDYNDWKVKDLRAEIAVRNEDRDEESQLPLTGNHDALVAVLEEDDQG